MPIVLVTDAPTASGHRYDDVIGKQYEFPQRYAEMVVPGDTFVYYRGSRGTSSGRPAYFGSGVVGEVRDSASPGHLIAGVHDVDLFHEPVPAKAADGTYIETGSSRGTNWPNGVRRIPGAVLERILHAAPAHVKPGAPLAEALHVFASAQHASAMERYSVQVALEELGNRFGLGSVREMPPGNPGFDIQVDATDRQLHVEVKGTVLPDPVFHLSEGQRQHAAALRSDFWLVVVYQVNVGHGTHRVAIVEDPVSGGRLELQPAAWTGRVVHSNPAV